jgi:hypothetical protein
MTKKHRGRQRHYSGSHWGNTRALGARGEMAEKGKQGDAKLQWLEQHKSLYFT